MSNDDTGGGVLVCAANRAQFRPVLTCNRPLSSVVSGSQDKNLSSLPTSYKVILFWIQRTRCWLHRKRENSLKFLQTCAAEPIHLGLEVTPPSPHSLPPSFRTVKSWGKVLLYWDLVLNKPREISFEHLQKKKQKTPVMRRESGGGEVGWIGRLGLTYIHTIKKT